MFEKNLNIGFLLDFYGVLLSDRKRSVMDMYYNEDLSLAEGKVSVTGRVGGLWYSEKKQKSEKRGFFAIGKR